VAFDEKLAKRVRAQLAARRDVAEKKMFGGLGFLVNGNMSVGIYGDELIVRIAPDAAEAALKEPGARVFDITGRPMKGWLMVAETGLADARSLAKWVRRGVEYAASLPKK
jgi:TfoX/Sxy family transcriptional regulator of competence genes